MKTTLAAVVLAVLTMTGCATAAPETPTPVESTGEAKYLANVKRVWFGPEPSDADLIIYGIAACDDLAAGIAIADVRVLPEASDAAVSVESSDADKNNWHVVRFAPPMCP